jgi:hypothetical protein
MRRRECHRAECKDLGFELLLGPGFSAGVREGRDYADADLDPGPAED